MQRKSYSLEIKGIFIQHKAEGKTLKWISEAIKVPFDTIKLWSSKIKQWESLIDKRSLNGRQKLFSDETLIEYIGTNKNATLKETGKYFKVSDVAILKRLKKLWYSFKKKSCAIKREMKT